jgi:O-antigen/teichoic acid export membrane protein
MQLTRTIVCEKKRKPDEDLTGRDRLVSNVLFSWAAHFVFIIAGFVLPRIIDRRLGQELLGVWDFAWSLVSYFGLVQAGVSSSVNRYVARYRAAGQISDVNRIVSSAFCILCVAGLLVLGLTITVSLLLPQLFGARLGENVLEAQWVVFFLGTSLAVQIAFGAFGGVLTGCHRWNLHNVNKSGWHLAMVAGMIVALLQGGGLRSLAMISFAGLALADATRVILAHWVCEGLRVRPSKVGWKTIRKLFFFGGKTVIPSVSRLLLNQTTSILIIAFLGPAALALYARPRSIINHINTLANKMAFVLIPTTSSLQSMGNLEKIRELLIMSVRYSFYLVLPMVLVLVVFGGAILRLWMGQRYANGLVPAILAVGYLITMAQAPMLNILAGLNAHGRAGIAQLVASLCSAGLTFLALGPLGWGIAGAAVAVTLPLTIMNLAYLPLLIRRQVGLDIRRYFLSVTMGPVVHVLPFVICLVIARIVFHTEPLIGLLWGGAAGGAILAVFYWRYVLPDRIKTCVFRYVGTRESVV